MKKLKKPLLSIITINYNSLAMTMELLSSIAPLKKSSWEVIVVDNGSDLNPEMTIKEKYPWVLTISSKVNLGFSGGNNLGILQAKGEYLFLINNDTEITQNLIPGMIRNFKADPQLGLLCPKIIYHNSDLIQFAGYTDLNFLARNSAIGKDQTDGSAYQQLISSPFGHGAAMMIHRKVLEKVGPMPEIYFLYYEELDWCEKIKNAGFKIKVDQGLVIYHKESRSIGKSSALKTYYLIRNRVLFVRRNFNPWPKLGFMLYFSLLAFPKTFLLHCLNRKPDHAKAIRKGFAWNFKNPAYTL